MKRFFILILFFLTSVCYPQSTLRVCIGLVTVETDDPACDESFVAGYESAGGHWTGQLTICENQSVDSLANSYKATNFDLVTWNGGGDFGSSIRSLRQMIPNSASGVQYVLPAGANNFRYHINVNPTLDPIICGSGWTENVTGYDCEFWDRDPQFTPDTIINIMRGGTQFTISQIARSTDSTIRITIAGNTNNAAGFEHGIPIRISGLSGTDISPLPSGLYYLSAGNANSLYFNFVTTNGTLGILQTPGSGTFKYGSSDANTFIRTSHWNLFLPLWGYTIFGVTGFQNNPNGIFGIAAYPNPDGFGDKTEIAFDVGSGAYTGGGHTSFNSQSYATPYTAGKIAFIKDSVSHKYNRVCSWWEARYRARVTASNDNTIDTYSGYGRINVGAAINYKGTIPPDPFNTIGQAGTLSATRSGNKVIVVFPFVSNAISYEVYRNADLLATYSAVSGVNYYVDTINRNRPGLMYKYWYKAIRGSQSTESGLVPVPYYYYRKMKIKNN